MRTFLLTIFRFDAKTDYLPHYKKQSISIDTKKPLKALLKAAVSSRSLAKLPKFGVKINGLAISLDVPLNQIYEKFGEELTILPLSTKRSVEDLFIDTKDFYERFDLLAPYVKEVDLDYFESLILLHYASPVLSYERDVFGTAFYFFAAKMIEKYPKFEKQIADIASDEKKGVNFHLPLDPYLFNSPKSIEEEIAALRSSIEKYFPKRIDKLLEEKEISFGASLESILNVSFKDIPKALATLSPKHSFGDFKAGIYLGSHESLSDFSKSIVAFTNLNASALFRSRHNDGGAIYPYDSNLACRMSGDILLEALDGGCDFLLLEDKKALAMLDAKQKSCAKAVGRGINLPVLTMEELALIALGEVEASGIKRHTIVPSFLPI
ncbi:MAG: DUF5644 domain-containing protein [Campylobacteraceae bacterium]|nr:DUF5644 domain-containing protein [Campylobacteraceae bacterium]